MGVCNSINNSRLNTSRTNNGLLRRTTTHFNKGETYYGKRGDDTERIMGPEDNLEGSQKVEAFLSLKNIKFTERIYKVKMLICNEKSRNEFISLGETENSNGFEIIFAMTFIFEYFFEKEQLLKFILISNEVDPISTILVTLGNIMGSRGSCLTLPFMKGEEKLCDLVVDCKNAVKSLTQLKLDVSGRLSISYRSIFFVISNLNDGKNWRPVYKSAEHNAVKLNYTQFNTITLKSDTLCGDEQLRPILLEFYDADTERKVGGATFNLNMLKTSPSDQIYLELNENVSLEKNQINQNKASVGDVIIKFTEQKIFKFIDYLKMGMQINLVVGVDFTSSNGDPERPDSLHYKYGNVSNPYHRAIQSCGTIVAYYDYDQKFPVYGFGGRLPGTTKVSHCFNLNLQSNPKVQGLEGILETYRSALNTVKQSAPTFFTPLIQTVLTNVKEEMKVNNYTYYILMILTDGIINDMDSTIDVLVECDVYPISVIIIGIGSADFSNMNVLDGDDIPLKNSSGRITRRDLVQFVEYKKYEDNINKLTEEVLQEIPRQVEEYYQLTNNFKYS